MRARQVVLLTPSRPSAPAPLLSRQHFVRLTLLAATLTKNRGEGGIIVNSKSPEGILSRGACRTGSLLESDGDPLLPLPLIFVALRPYNSMKYSDPQNHELRHASLAPPDRQRQAAKPARPDESPRRPLGPHLFAGISPPGGRSLDSLCGTRCQARRSRRSFLRESPRMAHRGLRHHRRRRRHRSRLLPRVPGPDDVHPEALWRQSCLRRWRGTIAKPSCRSQGTSRT